MESVREVRWRDDRSVRVHDREQGRRRHPPVAGLHYADATEPVSLADLEHPRPIGPFPLRLSRGFAHLSRRDMARAFLFGRRMIRETFIHVAGVGYRIEERIWRSGIRTWDDFSAAPRPPRIGQRLARRIEDEVERSAEALRSGRHRYFARKLPSREQWRAFDAFRRHVVYLDIETTGFSIGRHAVTVVGVYDGRRKRSFVQGDNLEDLPGALRQAKMLVTFNGSRFDVPFLRKAFPRMGLDLIHMDVLHSLRRLGFFGGLKSIEAEMGISRSDETSGLRGSDAIALWHAYEAGDDDALDLLLTYNLEDAVNLEPLAEFAYEALRSLCLDRGYVTADRYESDGHSVVRLRPSRHEDRAQAS